MKTKECIRNFAIARPAETKADCAYVMKQTEWMGPDRGGGKEEQGALL